MKPPKLPTPKQVAKMSDKDVLAWWFWLMNTMDFSYAIHGEIERRDLEDKT